MLKYQENLCEQNANSSISRLMCLNLDKKSIKDGDSAVQQQSHKGLPMLGCLLLSVCLAAASASNGSYILYTIYPDHPVAVDLTCPEDQDFTPGCNLVWNVTQAGHAVEVSCPRYTTGIITRKCVLSADGTHGVWLNPNITGCRNMFIEYYSKKLEPEHYEPNHVSEVTNNLQMLSYSLDRGYKHNLLYPYDLINAATVLRKMPQSISYEIYVVEDLRNFMKGLVGVVNRLLKVGTVPVWRAMDDERAVTDTMMGIIEAVEQNMQCAWDLAVTSCNNSQPSLLSTDTPYIYNVTESTVDLELLIFRERVILPEDITLVAFNGKSNVTIPAAVINKITKGGPFGIMKNAMQLSPIMMVESGLTQGNHTNTSREGTVNSEVLSVTILGVPDTALQYFPQPVTLYFQHVEQYPTWQGSCHFLLRNRSGVEDAWSKAGCQVAWGDESSTVCHCNHLTSFLIIMDIHDILEHLEEHEKGHYMALDIITITGSTLSIIACILAITLFHIYGVRSDNVRVHQMLALSIAMSQTVFLAGIGRTTDKIICAMVTVLLHFSLTALFAWMLVEGVHLCLLVVQVFNTTGIFKKYILFGWGVPFVIVLASVCVFQGGYHDSSCWLSNLALLTCFVPFVALTILVNLAVLMKTLTVLIASQNNHGRTGSAKFQNIRAGIRATFILTPLLGLCWLFGFLSLHPTHTIIFTYLFTITNTLQGLFVFLFHCLLNKEVQEAFVKRSRSINASRYMSDKNAETAVPQKDVKVTNLNLKVTDSPREDDDETYRDISRRLSKYSTDTVRTDITVVDGPQDQDGMS